MSDLFLFLLGIKLTDQMLDKLSADLDKREAALLAAILGMSQNDINDYLYDKNVPEKEAIFKLLKRWLKGQNSREEAYDLMGQALVRDDVGLNLLATEVLNYQSGVPVSNLHKNSKKLQNDQVEHISQKLRKNDMYRLAPKLNISSETVDSTFAKYCTNTEEAINDILQSWLKHQNSREEAYKNLAEAMIHPDVGLNLVAREVLGYLPPTETLTESQAQSNVTSDDNERRNSI